MLKNYFRITYRNIMRNKVFSLINILGLTIGISVSLAVFLIVEHELSFNRGIADSERIYRVNTVLARINRGVAAPISEVLKNDIAALELVVPIHNYTAKVDIVDANGPVKTFYRENRIGITVPEYFDMVTGYNWLAGSPLVLLEPFNVVLTVEQAEKYFGKYIDVENLVGRMVTYQDSLKLTVAGVVAPPQYNNDFTFTEFASYSTIEKSLFKNRIALKDWNSTSSSSQLFFKLPTDFSPQFLEEMLAIIQQKYEEANGEPNENTTYQFQPLGKLHFDKMLGAFDFSNNAVDLPTLYAMVGVAIILLLLATVNFINLETAQAGKRSKEIGIRKVLGSTKGQLIRQFLVHSTSITLVAALLALPLVQIGFIYFKEFIPQGLSLDPTMPIVVVFIVATVGLVGFAAGFYPALVISKYLPVQALKSDVITTSGKNKSTVLRQSLTVFQFGFAQLMIACTIICTQQIYFIQNKDLGFSSEAILYFYDGAESRGDLVKEELSKLVNVDTYTTFSRPPSYNGYSMNSMEYKDSVKVVNRYVHLIDTDENYFSFFEIKMAAGRVFAPVDSLREMVVNQTYANAIGFEQAEEAIDKRILLGSSYYRIVGVVSDFHLTSLNDAIEPLALIYNKNNSIFGLKLASNNGTDVHATIQSVKSSWERIYPNGNFHYEFLDDTISKFYTGERNLLKILLFTTGIAILISCLGLFGLVSFTVNQKTKEIGIRKVMGATVRHIVALVSGDFLRPILLALVFASPFAYYLADNWLQEFTYRIGISPFIFLLTGVVALVLAMGTMGYLTLKTAQANPVESLRNE